MDQGSCWKQGGAAHVPPKTLACVRVWPHRRHCLHLPPMGIAPGAGMAKGKTACFHELHAFMATELPAKRLLHTLPWPPGVDRLGMLQ